MKLPEPFVEQINKLLGNTANDFFESLHRPAPTAVRYNPQKKQVIGNLPYCNTALILETRPSFILDPLFHAGAYYVQEASSMAVGWVIEQLLQDYSGKVCLDLCAAPGGKSTHLAQILPPTWMLVSNEIHGHRASILTENIVKWGRSQHFVTRNAPADFSSLPPLFDLIVADVPCSGEGMFRKDPDSIQHWSEHNVNQCAVRQKKIIREVWNSLKPGGFLLYSTCTYNTTENEEIVDWICQELGGESVRIKTPEEWNVSESFITGIHAMRFFPHLTPGEGFFLSVIQKAGGSASIKLKQPAPKQLPFPLLSYTLQAEGLKAFEKDGNFYAVQDYFLAEHKVLHESLYFLHSGLLLGSIKAGKAIPSEFLPYNENFNRNSLPALHLDLQQALHVLSGGTDISGASQGWAVCMYDGLPISLGKVVGNRLNNYYPKEWRIKSSIREQE